MRAVGEAGAEARSRACVAVGALEEEEVTRAAYAPEAKSAMAIRGVEGCHLVRGGAVWAKPKSISMLSLGRPPVPR